jgi:serine/threonine-protein kinase
MRRFLREAEALGAAREPARGEGLRRARRDRRRHAPTSPWSFLRREDLASRLRRERRLTAPAPPSSSSARFALALEAARQAEIVHRDLKPQNLFRVEGSRLWKVLDFGVSKLGDTSGTLTRGFAIGTPGYMAPEQALGAEVDHRADLFALAVIAYRCLTGRPAFWGDDAPKIMFDVVYRQPVRPTDLVDLAEDVDRFFALALAKQPRDRLSRAPQLAGALRPGAGGSAVGGPPRARRSISRAPSVGTEDRGGDLTWFRAGARSLRPASRGR